MGGKTQNLDELGTLSFWVFLAHDLQNSEMTWESCCYAQQEENSDEWPPNLSFAYPCSNVESVIRCASDGSDKQTLNFGGISIGWMRHTKQLRLKQLHSKMTAISYVIDVSITCKWHRIIFQMTDRERTLRVSAECRGILLPCVTWRVLAEWGRSLLAKGQINKLILEICELLSIVLKQILFYQILSFFDLSSVLVLVIVHDFSALQIQSREVLCLWNWGYILKQWKQRQARQMGWTAWGFGRKSCSIETGDFHLRGCDTFRHPYMHWGM